MKSFKYIALSAILAVGVFYVAIYSSSCTKDACKGVTCLNKGMCSGGRCTCDTGIGGLNCETIYRLLYKNAYMGNAIVTYSQPDSAVIDSAFYSIYSGRTNDSNLVAFSINSDTTYNKMQLTWTDGTGQLLQTTITLNNNTATGSTFSIPATQGGPGDSFTVSGNGSVNSTNASLNLTAVPRHPTLTPTISYTLNNCSKL